MLRLIQFTALILVILLNSCYDRKKYDITSYIYDIPLDSITSELWFPELMAINARSMIGIKSKLCLIGPDEHMLTYYIDEKLVKSWDMQE